MTTSVVRNARSTSDPSASAGGPDHVARRGAPAPAPVRATVLAGLAAALLVTGAHAVVAHDPRAWSYLAVVATLAALAARLDRRVRFSAAVWAGLGLAAVGHLAGGVVRHPGVEGGVLYNVWLVEPVLRYDQLTHGAGYAVAALAVWELLVGWVDPGRSTTLGLALVAALVAAGIGAVNEVVEFVATFDLGGTAVGGFENTGYDLLFNLAGALTTSLFLAIRHGGPPARTNG